MQTLFKRLLLSTLHPWRWLGLLVCCGMAGAHAQPAELAQQAYATTTTEPLRVTSGSWPTAGQDNQGNSQVWQRAIWWQRHGAADLGWGVAYRQAAHAATSANGPAVAGAGASTLPTAAMALVAVGRPLTPSLSVHIGAGLPLGTAVPVHGWRDAGPEALTPDGRGELRMGLSFQARSTASQLRQGLALRVELSGSTALTLKPRAGRVGLQLNSQW